MVHQKELGKICVYPLTSKGGSSFRPRCAPGRYRPPGLHRPVFHCRSPDRPAAPRHRPGSRLPRCASTLHRPSHRNRTGRSSWFCSSGRQAANRGSNSLSSSCSAPMKDSRMPRHQSPSAVPRRIPPPGTSGHRLRQPVRPPAPSVPSARYCRYRSNIRSSFAHCVDQPHFPCTGDQAATVSRERSVPS